MKENRQDKMREIFNKLMETEEIGNRTAMSVSNTLNLINQTNKERNAQVSEKFSKSSPVLAKMKTQEIDNHFTVDMNNLLNFVRSGFSKDQVFENLSRLNDGWKKHPVLANALYKYSMDDKIIAAARSGAKYTGGYNQNTGEITFEYPRNVQERLEMV